ncbi:hypothetical protein [Bowmanella dokdonensis]|uniref:Uncharacterized protein n=1 Tax=Bowmanella dokdonensis TaxID=751969 RepID=A0A939DQ16_9ALTE|nr:hypothetical protein [Bowmanella dokdonensis]MBN7826864.1 hypothetical protein [Bowmanella dokdonensis]
MQLKKNKFLILGAIGSAMAALAHLGCIAFGGDWYRFFGAGEQMARMAEQGHWYPAAVTSALVVILLLWSLYALSGARVIVHLPFLRLGLCVIAGIYLLRGMAFVGIMRMFPDNSLSFWLVSSGICLSIGLLYAIGTYQAWPQLHRQAVRVE